MFFRFFPQHNHPAPVDEFKAALRIALEEMHKFVYIGNVQESDSNIYCPACGELQILKRGYNSTIQAQAGDLCQMLQSNTWYLAGLSAQHLFYR